MRAFAESRVDAGEYPRDVKTVLVYGVPAAVLHARENAVEIVPREQSGGSILWADIRISP